MFCSLQSSKHVAVATAVEVMEVVVVVVVW